MTAISLTILLRKYEPGASNVVRLGLGARSSAPSRFLPYRKPPTCHFLVRPLGLLA